MQKTAKIRWKHNEKQLLKGEIAKFNARRRYAIKKNPDLINFLPTLSYKEILNNITTRKDLKRILREINYSRTKDAFKLVNIGETKTTKWQLKVAKQRLANVNRRRAYERKRANVSTTKGTMGTIEQNNLKPKPFSIPSSQKEWQKFLESLEKQSNDKYWNEKDERYKQNYMTAFANAYGGFSGYVTRLTNLFAGLSAYDIVQGMYWSPILNIKFIYDDMDEGGHSETAELIIETWELYIEHLKQTKNQIG